MTINEWVNAVHKTARDKAWWDEHVARFGGLRELSPDTVLSKLMLVVTEVAEACEEVRDPDFPLEIAAIRDHDERRWHPSAKPEGFDIELADAVIRIMDLCGAMGIDLEAAMIAKQVYNGTRPIRHGGKRA